MTLRVTHFDHLVLKVDDVERSLAFYLDKLGLAPVRVEEWRAGRVPFPSVRISADTIVDLIVGERGEPNVDHFCLVVEPLDWDAFVASGEFDVIEGPVNRFGARGTGRSVYVRDPDANVIELRWYEGE